MPLLTADNMIITENMATTRATTTADHERILQEQYLSPIAAAVEEALPGSKVAVNNAKNGSGSVSSVIYHNGSYPVIGLTVSYDQHGRSPVTVKVEVPFSIQPLENNSLVAIIDGTLSSFRGTHELAEMVAEIIRIQSSPITWNDLFGGKPPERREPIERPYG